MSIGKGMLTVGVVATAGFLAGCDDPAETARMQAEAAREVERAESEKAKERAKRSLEEAKSFIVEDPGPTKFGLDLLENDDGKDQRNY